MNLLWILHNAGFSNRRMTMCIKLVLFCPPFVFFSYLWIVRMLIASCNAAVNFDSDFRCFIWMWTWPWPHLPCVKDASVPDVHTCKFRPCVSWSLKAFRTNALRLIHIGDELEWIELPLKCSIQDEFQFVSGEKAGHCLTHQPGVRITETSSVLWSTFAISRQKSTHAGVLQLTNV